jgi:hypothetical protein
VGLTLGWPPWPKWFFPDRDLAVPAKFPKEDLPWPPMFWTRGGEVCFGAAITSAAEQTVNATALYGSLLLNFILKPLPVFGPDNCASRKNF